MAYTDSAGGGWVTRVPVFYKYQNGTNTSNFRNNQLRPRPLPVNDYVMDCVEHYPGTKRFIYRDFVNETVFASTLSCQTYTFEYPRGDMESEVDSRLTSKLLDEMKDMKVNLAQAAAESAQTANLLATTARRITSSFSNLRRGNYLGACKALGVSLRKNKKKRYEAKYAKDPLHAAAGAWLELQYGWKPLLQDVYGAAETIARERGSRPLYQEVTANVTIKRKFDYSTRDVTDGYANVFSSGGTAVSRGKAKILFSVDNQALRLASSVGLTDPALLAWELLPYSFVVDWFLPVGNWLQRCNATAGLTFQSGHRSIRTTASGSTSYSYTSQQPGIFARSETMDGAKVVTNHLRRTVMSGFPANPLPTFKNPVSFTHLANSVALLQSVFDLTKPLRAGNRRE